MGTSVLEEQSKFPTYSLSLDNSTDEFDEYFELSSVPAKSCDLCISRS